MGNIQVLPEVLANQIAAGEVVERPASCIKELVENSLDAGARSIIVAIEDGGISRIVVQDDGSGMEEDDARLAFSRHATSKIKTQRDLFRIATLGFRGEALASIAAVAKVRLQTRPASRTSGIEVSVEGGTMNPEPTEVGMPPGTKIEISDLFFNTPARLKYLRTVATEQARCVDVVHKAALSRPDVAFRCEVGGHVVFQTTGRGDVREVLAALLGTGEARQCIHVEGKSADYTISGWIGRPTQGKANRNSGHLFINQRSIRNIAVHNAVVSGYGNRLMVNRHPVYALYIEMDATLVDVNIHPHKSEVRFSEERDLVQLVQEAVRTALGETFLVPTAAFGHRNADGQREENLPSYQAALNLRAPTSSATPSVDANTEADKQSTNRQHYSYPNQGGASARHGASSTEYPGKQADWKTERQALRPENWGAVLSSLTPNPVVREASGMTEAAATDLATADSVEVSQQVPAGWRLRPIGQALGMYILADDGEHLYVIDQHAAHERVLYEKFSRRMSEQTVHSIALITPLPLTLSGEEWTALEENAAVLESMGLSFEPFGGRDVLLRQIPCVWEGLDYGVLVQDFLQAITELTRKHDVRTVLRERIVMKACKAAIKANEYMSEMEMNALCEALSTLEDPFHCPHGRPVFIRLSSKDLEKEFRRIV